LKRKIILFKKDHHSVKAFPDKDPVVIQLVYGVSTGLSAVLFGYLGDFTVKNLINIFKLLRLIVDFII